MLEELTLAEHYLAGGTDFERIGFDLVVVRQGRHEIETFLGCTMIGTMTQSFQRMILAGSVGVVIDRKS